MNKPTLKLTLNELEQRTRETAGYWLLDHELA